VGQMGLIAQLLALPHSVLPGTKGDGYVAKVTQDIVKDLHDVRNKLNAVVTGDRTELGPVV